ncbi:MAG: PilZ domain-containing protein [Desulfobacterales bacterium]|nr:PilZ domain-containing protein [Desulfobacterales bacterium]
MGERDRRIHARVPASFKVNYIHRKNYIISFNRDISVDGMFICAADPPPVGSQVKLLFSFGALKEVEVPAAVVWVKRGKDPLERGMGVQFLDQPTLELKENILHYIDRIKVLHPELGNA